MARGRGQESIADEHTRVVQELHRLRDENATLSDRFRQLQERVR